ncbi:MAG TPA: stalk domain-containing protein [Armatimonadota bacterium]|nr:stalk domain-containing protein [Armatimonadota bacterium]
MMRFTTIFIIPLLIASYLIAQPATPGVNSPTTLIYTSIRSDVSPVVRSGRTFVPVRVISEQFGATVNWRPANQQIVIQQTGQPQILLTINSRIARIGNRQVTLDAIPFTFQGRTMVPLRFIAESYGIPVTYDQPTNSVYLDRNGRRYVLPFLSTRTGIIIADPKPGEVVKNPILLQGQANVFEGQLIIEVQDAQGHILGHSTTLAGMGGFYPYSTNVNYNLPAQQITNGRIVVYSQDGRGDNRILARATVNVRLSPTR